MSEQAYQHVVTRFLKYQSGVDEFINEFMQLWKTDRNLATLDPRFRRLIDRLFTSCDCYRPEPLEAHEISEEELRSEVALLSYIWWS
ncbi:hypothetical protein HHL22_07455 [Hymenobacter sp. RP-2-7]|uniref:Colicin D immunity protein domain-containing protein n=1 Tax=Hymenobacter polaris TaxID=2682546 RepID=A0A7Y0FM44_9BACT|nr:colicin immunity domain-containing protein [Hymenobacter polaris]NML65039.1 hypothetical protein [Hymenobacter polaris]